MSRRVHVQSLFRIAGICVALGASAPSFAGERTADSPPATATPDRVVASPRPANRVASQPAPQPASQPVPVAPQPETPGVSSQSGPLLSSEPVVTSLHIDAMLGFASDNLGLGLGARAGKTFANHLYLGGLLVYQVGTHSSTTTVGITSSASASAIYIGPEVGYDLQFTGLPVVFRPYLGLGFGDAFVSSSVNGGMSTSASSNQLSIWPGVAGSYRIAGSSFVVGGDFRIVTGPWPTAVGLFATGGMYL
jgi:hypothetical protein